MNTVGMGGVGVGVSGSRGGEHHHHHELPQGKDESRGPQEQQQQQQWKDRQQGAKDNDSHHYHDSCQEGHENYDNEEEEVNIFVDVRYYRPRLLYASVFVWMSITGGRFLAPFLEHEAHFPNAMTGTCLALQTAIVTASSVMGSGNLADAHERRHPGRGRATIMAAGIVLATLCFLLQGMHRILNLLLISQQQHEQQRRLLWLVSSHAWHLTLRGLYAASYSFVFPVLEGMTLDFLCKQHELETLRIETHKNNQSQQQKSLDNSNSNRSKSSNHRDEYGKERLHGAIWWAIANALLLAPLLDFWQGDFAFFYPAGLLSAVIVLGSLVLYVQGQQGQDQEMQRLRQQLQEQHEQGRFAKNGDCELVALRRNDDCADEHLAQQDESCMGATSSPEDSSIKTKKQNNAAAVDTDADEADIPMMALIGKLLTTVTSIAFVCAIICLSQGQAIVDNLIFLYFEVLGSTYTLMGLTVVLTVSFEIPIFHVAPTLLRTVGSRGLLIMACACYVTRVLCYTLIPPGHAWLVLFLEPLHGITYACSQTAAVDFVANLMPLGYEASGQGILQAMRGIGSVFGLAVGGWMDDVMGPRFMYRLSALLVLVGSTVFGLAIAWEHQQQQHAAAAAVSQTPQKDAIDKDCHPSDHGAAYCQPPRQSRTDRFDLPRRLVRAPAIRTRATTRCKFTAIPQNDFEATTTAATTFTDSLEDDNEKGDSIGTT